MTADREAPIAELNEHYRAERAKLDHLTPPNLWMRAEDDEFIFQLQGGLSYALDFVDVFLNRIAAIESKVAALQGQRN